MSTNRKRSLIPLIVALVLFSVSVHARQEKQGPPVLDNTTLMLPSDSRIKVRWVVPPLDEAEVRKAHWTDIRFSVDNAGNPWIGYNKKFLLSPRKKYVIRISHSYKGIVHLDNGALLMVTDTELGFLVPWGDLHTDGKGLPVVPFQPIASLPLPEASLFKGFGNSLYFAGRNNETKGFEVYLLRPETIRTGKTETRLIREYRKVFAGSEPITAVTGAGDVTYIAMGKLVIKVVGIENTVNRVFLHPSSEIHSLAYDPDAGLFYATESGVGCIGANGPVEILHTCSPEIALRQGSLYVLFKKNMGVLALDNRR